MPDDIQPLLEPYLLGDLPLPNRIVMAPLTRARAQNPAHVPNDLMREYYEQRTTAGLIISEGIWTSENAIGWLGAAGIYNEEQGAAWKSITDAVHSKGGRIFAQLWHQGGTSHPEFFADGRLPLAPSAVNPMQPVHTRNGARTTVTPRAMTVADIKETLDDYRNAAQIAKDAGFDGVQLHAGHVYLIQHFLQETTNKRTDAYVGSIENRARFLFEALEAILEMWPSQRVGIRTGPITNEIGAFKASESTIAVSDYVYGKLDTYDLSHVLVTRSQVDLTGTPIAALAGDHVIHHLRKHYSGTFILNSGIDREHANRLLKDDPRFLVAFGRPFIANPDFVERIRLNAPLNELRPEGFYGPSPVGYTDYPSLTQDQLETLKREMKKEAHVHPSKRWPIKARL